MPVRKVFLAISTMLSIAAQSATAQTALEQVVDQLQQQNFSRIEVQRTFLGRLRITAARGGVEREVVLNPSTGAILRDYSTSRGGDDGKAAPDLAPGREDRNVARSDERTDRQAHAERSEKPEKSVDKDRSSPPDEKPERDNRDGPEPSSHDRKDRD
ncbi:hypothetical protein [Sagittula sp. S175]|uniref:hypothetical protein n=1 Tax=Sagittula sp. S175 TaxID=3415129 RepID=UPI003C7AE31C